MHLRIFEHNSKKKIPTDMLHYNGFFFVFYRGKPSSSTMLELSAADMCSLCGPIIYFASKRAELIPVFNCIQDNWMIASSSNAPLPILQRLIRAFYHFRTVVPDAIIDECIDIWRNCTDAKTTSLYLESSLQSVPAEYRDPIVEALLEFVSFAMAGMKARTTAQQCRKGRACKLPYCVCSLDTTNIGADIQQDICNIYNELVDDTTTPTQVLQNNNDDDGYETEDDSYTAHVWVPETPNKPKRKYDNDDIVVFETPQKKRK